MRTLARVVIVMAVLNLGAILAGVGWLIASGRLDMDRARELVGTLGETIAEEEARLEEERRQREAEKAQEEAEEVPEIGMTANELNTVRVELTQIDRDRLERMEREIEDLRATLRRERLLLEQERDEFEEEKQAFRAMRERVTANQDDEQFKKALNTLSRMAPEDAMKSLDATLEAGDRAIVVSYLSEMGDRIRKNVLSEFVDDGRPELAAELLDAVRRHGVDTASADDPAP